MFLMFIFSMLLLNFMFIFTSHPMLMTLTIIFQTLMTCLLINLFSMSLWYSYILFLVFLGGMLILFIYITTLASNEKLTFNLIKLPLMIFFSLTFITFLNLNLKYSLMMNQDSLNIQYFINYYESPNNLNMLYNNPNYIITVILICYLLMTLIIVVNISNPKMGSLRQLY